MSSAALRCSTGSDVKPCRPSRHTEFWFSDGSVVLLANDVLFRVHKSFLARHSLVFRVVDGCPVIRLHDSPDDVASLLYALYDGPKFGDNSNADFRVVSGILRLASKYIIDSLRTRALEHLSIAWPATLKGWDAREEVLDNVGLSSEESRFYPNPIEVINLAREVNAPSLLPSAFYDLSRYPLAEVFELSQRACEAGVDLPSHVKLSLFDTQRLALGKEAAYCSVTALIRSVATEARSNPAHYQHTQVHTNGHHTQARRFAARHTHRRSDSGGSGIGRCASPATCWRDVSELVDLATQHYLFDRERGAADPLYVAEELALLKGTGDAYGSPEAPRVDLGGPSPNHSVAFGLLDEDLGEAGTCRACSRAFEVWSTKERERLWRSIPSWFKIDL